MDFMLQLSKEELDSWRSQIVISNPGAKKGLRYAPYAARRRLKSNIHAPLTAESFARHTDR
jgi:hypothetical protein